MAKVMDFAATRAALQEQIASEQLRLTELRDRIGELALDCALGTVPISELEAARAEQVALTAHVSELEAALGKLDDREADHEAAKVEKRRQAKERRLAELGPLCDAAGVRVVELTRQLSAVLAEGRAASHEAMELARELGLAGSGVDHWERAAMRLIGARAGLPLMRMPAADLEDTERALTRTA